MLLAGPPQGTLYEHPDRRPGERGHIFFPLQTLKREALQGTGDCQGVEI